MKLPYCSLFAFLIFIANVVFAQQIDYRKNYYPLINKAELALTSGNLEVALTNYEEAFSKVPSAFSKDIYNAALCAAINKKGKLCVALCKKLVLKGTDITFLLAQRVFRNIEDTSDWEYFIKNYPNLRKQYLLKVNMPLRKQLELMWANDQHFRIKPNGLSIYKDTIASIERDNIKYLIKIFQKYTFPDETLIGVDNPMTNILANAVKYGKLSPSKYAAYVDIQGKPVYGNTTFYRIGKEGELRYFKMKDKEIKKINKRRKAMGLEPIGDYRKKLLFSLKNKNFIFDFTDSIIALKGLDEKSIEKLLENTNTVKVE